jgi:diguanylate cyclase (GGDEF)-like protein
LEDIAGVRYPGDGLMKQALTAVILLTAWATAAAVPVQLSSVATVQALSHAQAAQGIPADFEATVTYFRSYEHTMFVQDGTAAIYVGATTNLHLVPGDRIRVRGSTQDSFRPVVISSDLTLLRHGPPPAPVAAAFIPMVRSEFDCRYVTVHGTVLSANMSLSSGRSVTAMELRMDGGNVGVIMDTDDASRLKGLLDAEVEVTGAVSGRFDGKMQMTGLLVHTMSFNQVKILKRARADAWSTPVAPMDKVLRNFDVTDRTQRVRVQGTLTYYHQTSMAVVQDGGRSIRVLTPQIAELRVGDRVEAIGIPFVDNGFLTLKLGEVRSTGRAVPIEPRLVTWDELASGKFAFDLISIEGSVVSQVREHAQDFYIISAQNHLFSATVRHPFVYEWNVPVEPPPIPEIRPGSRVRVTGVAILDDANPFNGAMAFGVLLNSSSDVAVLARPSWLTVQNLSTIVSVLLLVIVIVATWGAMLRRQVRLRTTELATRIQAEANLERRRSQILEDINGTRLLRDVLAEIADLVSSSLSGVPCWVQIGDREPVGNRPAEIELEQVIRQDIPSRSGQEHGVICAHLDARSPLGANASEALSMGAWLATLAIETRSLYSDLVHRSEFDLLTDIHNRFNLEKRIDKLIVESGTGMSKFGLIYIDLDEFKQVNDLFGHRIGDVYLQIAAQRMKRQLRPGDILARLGGDEFAALVAPVRDRREAEEIGNRLEHCFDEPFLLDGHSIHGAASVGIALFAEDGQTRDALFSRADAAMYAVKHRRRLTAATPAPAGSSSRTS